MMASCKEWALYTLSKTFGGNKFVRHRLCLLDRRSPSVKIFNLLQILSTEPVFSAGFAGIWPCYNWWLKLTTSEMHHRAIWQKIWIETRGIINLSTTQTSRLCDNLWQFVISQRFYVVKFDSRGKWCIVSIVKCIRSPESSPLSTVT